MPGTRKLGRPTDHRMSMLKGQVTFLLENGSLETTVTRAKELKALTDKMITLGKTNTLASKRQALSFITKEDVVKKLFDEIAPKYEERNGGYTRVLKMGPRRGDGAEMALIELVGFEKKEETKKKSILGRAGKKAKKEAPAKAEEAKVEEVKTEATAEAVEAPAEEKAADAE